MDIPAKVISASKVASLASGDPIDGTPDRKEFGKLFEEAYQYTCWAWKGVPWRDISAIPDQCNQACPRCGKTTETFYTTCNYCNRKWHPGCSAFATSEATGAVTCRNCTGRAMMETFDQKMGVNDEARKIAAAMFRANIRGLTPATLFRQIPAAPGHYISAKPDLRNEVGTWFEFKTYAIRPYAIMQCKIFSWVVGHAVTLVTWDGEHVKKTRVDGRDFAIPPIPEGWFTDRPDSWVNGRNGS